MRRPEFIQHLFIQNEQFLSIKATITLRKIRKDSTIPLFPLRDIPLLRRQRFTLKIILRDEKGQVISQHLFDTDSFGQALFRIPLPPKGHVASLQCFETSFSPGVDFLLGNLYPLSIKRPTKLVISDFDKTLVSTSYSGLLDLVTSLINPIAYFPPINDGLELFKKYIQQDYSSFVLSASPHFYEATIRDWLCSQGLMTSELFLKDYRQSFSISDGLLAPKDLWVQGLFKLDHLLDLLVMCALPDEIVLLGDDHESDPMIYLTLAQIITDPNEPFRVWQKIVANKSFNLSKKQSVKLLSKIYEISSFLYDRKKQGHALPKIKIHIRQTGKKNKIPQDLKETLKDKIFFDFF